MIWKETVLFLPFNYGYLFYLFIALAKTTSNCYCLVTQSGLTLCDPMDCSTPGFPVYHQLPEFAQTHVHRVSDAIQPLYSVFWRYTKSKLVSLNKWIKSITYTQSIYLEKYTIVLKNREQINSELSNKCFWKSSVLLLRIFKGCLNHVAS